MFPESKFSQTVATIDCLFDELEEKMELSVQDVAGLKNLKEKPSDPEI